MPVYTLGDVEPEIHPDAHVHPDAVVIQRGEQVRAQLRRLAG